ncbi:hypothetical protein [Nocardioides jishulii]|uniref:ESX-1 secretion-associated protein n=1 Tax=Nocardioides jishulii TaxID=2575440 RepID=A0A4U2YMR5_9ACTN|nr:hypothetical protein [Nocardioides jishulii]QCX27731.1 hypothetical protein FCL41_09475 [Nocardioides jishulii]TKI62537.1 hypothetical protein FC770_09140 [Nocardioides jishulii]
MTSSDDPEARADNARQALRLLAHATRHITDPTPIYPILGDLSNGLASCAQSLHQLAALHEGPAREHAQQAGDAHKRSAASYQIAWELHRAAVMVAQAAKILDKAHELEATITYDLSHADQSIEPPRGHGMSL